MALPQKVYTFTFADVLEGSEEERVELMDGELIMMGSPRRIHQEIVGELFAQLHDFLRDKPCRVYPAPFSVRPFARKGDRPEEIDTMVEPDISVVCDPDKLDEYGCIGAPDMIAEVLSPSGKNYDRFRKFLLYERAGVREYWIIDPDTRTVSVHLLEDGRYGAGQVYTAGASIPVSVLDGFLIDAARMFPDDTPA